MLQNSRWKMSLVLLVVLMAIVVDIPNFFSASSVSKWPSWLPHQQVVLGLDLQGGAYLLYQVDQTDYVQKRLRTLVGDIRKAMLEDPRIGYTGLGIQGEVVQLRVRDLSQLDEARKRLEPLRNSLNAGIIGGSSVYEFDLSVADNGLVRFTYDQNGLAQRIRGIVQQSIEVINRRINQLGTTEPSIQRQGNDRILVEAPGLGDPARLKSLVGQTAQLTFHLVKSSLTKDQADSQPVPPGMLEFPSEEDPNTVYVVEDTALMTGEDLVDAQAGFDSRTNQPVVNFRLSTSGARIFGDVTAKNVGRPFAIVLDNKVISAPVIQTPILGGSGQISGHFTVQSANDLAILLRAGSLPAKLTIVEERTVGPGLGAELDPRRQDRGADRHALRGLVHVRDLRLLRPHRQHRRADQRGDHLLGADPSRCDADAARHRRHRVDHRHGGRLERADLRAHPRGVPQRAHGDRLDRCRLPARAGHHSRC